MASVMTVIPIGFVRGGRTDLRDASGPQAAVVGFAVSADGPTGEELARLKRLYFANYPDGVERQSWKGITHLRVRPTWARYSDFRGREPRVDEGSG